MRPIPFLLFPFLLMHAFVNAQVNPRETYQWSHTWMVTKPDSAPLRSILIIGDSHVERYHPVVAELLKGRFYVSKITTAKSLGDPQLLRQIDGLIGNNLFDMIFFNNGLHGVKYSPDAYAGYLSPMLKLLRKNNRSVKIVWVNTTARRVNGDLDAFDPYNDDVRTRNDRVSSFCKKKGLTMIDFWSMSLHKKEYYHPDGIHFMPIGVEAQAALIVKEAMAVLKP